MSVSGISGSTSYQLFQVASQRNNGQAVGKTQNEQQGQQEESGEGAAVKTSEGTEALESSSINIYA